MLKRSCGVIAFVVAAGFLTGCTPLPAIEVSPATIHLESGQTTAEFFVWNGGEKDSQLTFSVAPQEGDDWYAIYPDAGASASPQDKRTIQVAINEIALKAQVSGVILVSATIDKKTVQKEVPITKAQNYYTQEFLRGVPLSGKSITFTPAAGLSRYTAAILDDVSGWPTDPDGGLLLDFQVEDPHPVALPEDNSFPFYGENYQDFFVASGGSVSFGSPSPAPETLEEHFAVPRITALTNMDAAQEGAEVSVIAETDRVAVTFDKVPTVGKEVSGSDFQIEMFFNGTIRLTYLFIDTYRSLIGLSPGGGLPDDFTPSDLTVDYNTGSLGAQS